MKTYRKELWLEVPARQGFINITRLIEDCVRASQITEGLALINPLHTTSSIFINDYEEGLNPDYQAWLERLAPVKPVQQYHNNATGEDNVDAHMKRLLMGREAVVAVTEGRLDFGNWEQIIYGEFDGGRKKRVLVKIIGE